MSANDGNWTGDWIVNQIAASVDRAGHVPDHVVAKRKCRVVVEQVNAAEEFPFTAVAAARAVVEHAWESPLSRP